MAEKVWTPEHCVHWIYPRENGDIEIFARTRDEAAIAMFQHGFRNFDPEKLYRTEKPALIEFLAPPKPTKLLDVPGKSGQ